MVFTVYHESQTGNEDRARFSRTRLGFHQGVSVDDHGCSIQPASTGLSQDGRVLGVSDGMTVYCPEGSDVQAGDHIVANGQTYEIQGEPRVWTGAFTRSHVQLNLIRWEG